MTLLSGLPSYRSRVVSHVERVAVEQILANARACTCHPLVSLNWLSADTNSDESVCRLPRNQGSNVALSPCLYSVGSPSESYLALWGVVRGGPLLLKPLAMPTVVGLRERSLAFLSCARLPRSATMANRRANHLVYRAPATRQGRHCVLCH